MPKQAGSNRVRIIGGEHRGRVLHFIDATGLRPTGDRIRETLFNWLQFHLPGARCLDLFAGSGVLGFETASRGAAHVTMVEKQDHVFARLEKNRALLGLEGRVTLEHRDALKWLGDNRESFDIVFLDPPFNRQLLQPAIDLLSHAQHLAAGARVYIEQDASEAPPNLPDNWKIIREKRAGQVRYRLYEVGE